MAYELGWSSNHPGHVVYILDLSGSMANNEKIDKLIDAVHTVVIDLIQESAPSGKIDNNLTLTIFGYNKTVTKLLDNLPLSAIDDKLDKDDVLLNKETNAKPISQTFTAQAFEAATEEIKSWIDNQKKKTKLIPAPLVVHVTDGYPYEGEGTDEISFEKAAKAAEELKAVRTDDGNVRLFNIHIEPNMPEYKFPTSRPTGDKVNDKVMKFLFDSATEVDEGARKNADLFLGSGLIQPGAKFMVSNISGQDLLSKLIRFGSTPSSVKLQ